jgi:hypothetical protein
MVFTVQWTKILKSVSYDTLYKPLLNLDSISPLSKPFREPTVTSHSSKFKKYYIEIRELMNTISTSPVCLRAIPI